MTSPREPLISLYRRIHFDPHWCKSLSQKCDWIIFMPISKSCGETLRWKIIRYRPPMIRSCCDNRMERSSALDKLNHLRCWEIQNNHILQCQFKLHITLKHGKWKLYHGEHLCWCIHRPPCGYCLIYFIRAWWLELNEENVKLLA